MPWSNNGGGPKSSGPWGGGGGGNNGGGNNPWGGGSGGGSGGGQGPKIDDYFKKGQHQLKSAFGEGGGIGVLLVMLVAAVAWVYASVFQVEQNERAIILTFGKFSTVVGPGLNFAPWPVQTAIIREVTTNNTITIGGPGTSLECERSVGTDSLMLTGDENIVDINFEVVWVIDDLQKFEFNLANPAETICAVAESTMREIVGRSRLAPLLNEQRGQLVAEVEQLSQRTLDQYDSGVRIVRVTLDKADPPPEVNAAFLAVQAAEQERDQLIQEAEKYYNQKTAGARGEARKRIEEAKGYLAEQVAAARGEAARFNAVLEAYLIAPEVTKKRLYIEAMERVLRGSQKVFIDSDQSGSGVVPFLPLDRLGGSRAPGQASGPRGAEQTR